MPIKQEKRLSSEPPSSPVSPVTTPSKSPNKAKQWAIQDDYDMLLILYSMTNPGNLTAQQKKAIASCIGRTERAVQMRYSSIIKPALERLKGGGSGGDESPEP